MKEIIPYGKHFLDEEDIEAVVEVLRTKNLTQGEEVDKFEEAVAKYVGAKYAVAVSSWTAGLHIACLAAGVQTDDEVLTSPITFVSSANCAVFCGAKPVFSDIDNESLNLCPSKLRDSLSKLSNTKVIIPVHYAGAPCDMKSIKEIADKSGTLIIEDAAHALGSRYEDGSMVGSCKYSDMTGFSFHPVKSIAAGEGGMITTNNYDLYKKLLRLRSHGINKLDDSFLIQDQATTGDIDNPWYYEMQDLGYNYRITDIQCALGRSQLKKLDKFIGRRRQLVSRYDAAFEGSEKINPTQIQFRSSSSYHLYVVRINFKKTNINRAQLMNELKQEGILTQVHYIPVTSHPFYKELGFDTRQYPNSLNFFEEALSLPLYYSLTDQQQDSVINTIKEKLS